MLRCNGVRVDFRHGFLQVPLILPRTKELAERVGFEPTERFDPFTRFPSEHNRPLCHLS
jgi:hypothetical protein